MDKMIKLDLVGSIRFQTTNEIIKCIVRAISEDYTKALVFASNDRICCDASIELIIYSPLESSPIRCNGKIFAEPNENNDIIIEGSGYVVNIYITHIGRLEQRRLSVLLAQKRAFISSG